MNFSYILILLLVMPVYAISDLTGPSADLVAIALRINKQTLQSFMLEPNNLGDNNSIKINYFVTELPSGEITKKFIFTKQRNFNLIAHIPTGKEIDIIRSAYPELMIELEKSLNTEGL